MTAVENAASAEWLVRRQVVELPAYNAGLPEQVVFEKYGVKKAIRLASNENPLGASPLAVEAAVAAAGSIWKYSDPESSGLRKALANKMELDPQRLVMGNGSEELIALVCRACLRPGDRCVTVTPSFLLHEIYSLEQGAVVEKVPMTKDLRFDLENIEKAVRTGCRMLIFSNPSNPVGVAMSTAEFDRVLAALSPETLLVVDEAYHEYARVEEDYPDVVEKLQTSSLQFCVLRTFSKAYGLAGSRVGYGIFSDTWFAEQINKLRPPFNVNLIAQATAIAALQDVSHLNRTIRQNKEERGVVTKKLQELGCQVGKSYANFVFVKTKTDSVQIAEKLLYKGIIVKPWQTEGYADYLRVTIGRPEDNLLFLKNLTAILE